MANKRLKLFIKYIQLSSYGRDYVSNSTEEYFNSVQTVNALKKLSNWCGEDARTFVEQSLLELNFEGRYKTLMNHYMVKSLTPNEVASLMGCDDFIKGMTSAKPITYPIFRDNKEIFVQDNINPIRKYQLALDIAEAVENDNFYSHTIFAKYINYVNHGKDYSAVFASDFYEAKCIKVLSKLEKNGVDIEKFIHDTLSCENVSERFEQLMLNVHSNVLSAKDLKFVMPYNEFIVALTSKYPNTAEKFGYVAKVYESPNCDIDKKFKTAVIVENEEHLKSFYSKGYIYSSNPIVEEIMQEGSVELQPFADDFTNN